MKRDQIEELAALDALGALDGEDMAVWEALQNADPAAAALREELSGAAAQLSLLASPVAAPAALRQRVMDRVFAEADPVREADPAPRTFGWGAWAAAAAIFVLALAGTSFTTQQKASVVVRDVRPNPVAQHIPLTGYGDYAEVKATVLWDSGQRGWYVQAEGLPALPASHRYRVWAIDAGGEVHDCGELPLRHGGLARRFVQPGDAIDSMQGFAVTIEPADSAPAAPTSPAVLISALPG